MNQISKFRLCRLEDLAEVKDGTHESPKYHSAGIPFITSKNLVDGNIDFSNVNYISETDHESFSRRSNVEDGDILFGMIGTIGNPVRVQKDREFSIKNVALIKSNKALIDGEFLYQVLKSPIFDKQFSVKSNVGAQAFVSLKIIKELVVPTPIIAEQKKIAEILSTWDEAISFYTELIYYLQLRKKQVFSYLTKKPEQTISLAELIAKKWCRVIVGSDIEWSTKKKLYLSTSSVDGDKMVSNEGYVTQNKKPSRAQLPALENSVWFAKMQGTVKVVHFEEPEEIILSTGFYGFVPNEIDFHGGYLKQVFLSDKFNQKKDQLCEGSSQSGIKNTHLEELTIPLFDYLKQKNISEVLGSIDREIYSYQKLLVALKSQKLGLMQQLLTGKIRVKVS